MLTEISIRNIVLIRELDLNFKSGLCALTGETGAGKSILLDAMGLILGMRAENHLVRPGTDQAVVTARFENTTNPEIQTLLNEHGIDAEESLIIKRILPRDGASKAFINDQPASAGLLKKLGALLVEIQGQFDQHALLDPATHIHTLDLFGRLQNQTSDLSTRWQNWKEAEQAWKSAIATQEKAKADEEFLRHAVKELEILDPQPGEHTELAEKRALLMNVEKITLALGESYGELTNEQGAEPALAKAHKSLSRLNHLPEKIQNLLETINRALNETAAAIASIEELQQDEDLNPATLPAIEDRLFAMKDLARKHQIEIENLANLKDDLQQKLNLIEDGSAQIQKLKKQAEQHQAEFEKAALALHEQRVNTAKQLDQKIMAELPPLKLEKAVFATALKKLSLENATPTGISDVEFHVSTNPGMPLAPLAKIASGGELSRFMLAIKVVLSAVNIVPTLVFDEVDSGVGGAVADAVGERLARLGQNTQILVVTHSPQVAARANHHYQITKQDVDNTTTTSVIQLSSAARHEEIARMLSGATITDQARSAAKSLMTGT